MGSEHYCLRWNNHQSNLLGVFSQLLQDESLVDVTLACSEGASIRAHKVVLSACSSYFQSLFVDHPSRHPIVILKDVRFAELRTLIEFMYKGEVNVQYCQLSALLKTAESLKVKGLAEMTNLNSTTTREIERTPESLLNINRNQQQQQQTQQQQQQQQQQQHVHQQHHHDNPTSRHIDTLTRHDRKTNNNSLNDNVDMLNKRLAPPEESSTPPPRLGICPNPLALISRGSRNRPEPLDPGPDELKLELKRDPGDDTRRASSPEDEISSHNSNCGPSEIGINMTINANTNNNISATCTTADLRLGPCSSAGASATVTAPVPGISRLPSPLSEPVAGPSGLPPVQQVPLSLKKEMDWDRGGDDKSTGESSSEYRHPHDLELGAEPGGHSAHSEGSPRLYPCMYCGAAFPHQSKLTRHILSHSLETLKYREQIHMQHTLGFAVGIGGCEPLNLMEPHFTGRALPPEKHEPPDTPMDLDFTAGAPDQGNVVLCKFCGKSFPDVTSLISHLPVHTGDRPFKCEFCGKAFKLRHHMKDHCRVHTGERPFRCALCGKTFSRSTILKAHEKTHYPKYVRKFLSPSPVDTEEESPHQ